MTTYSQLGRKRHSSVSNRFMQKCQPQVRGRVLHNFTMSPRKPNSARRKTSRVILSTKQVIFARARGAGTIPTKYASVLVCPGGYRDTPQVNYTMIRGSLECLAIFNRNRRRSIFGVKKRLNVYVRIK